MNHLKLALIISIIFTTYLARADSVIEHSRDHDLCQVTKIIMNDYEPEEFQPSNNLLRKTGEEEMFCGEKIIVHGRVLDRSCTPVSDAKIYIWQANCNGKYPYKPLKDVAKQSLIDINCHLTFTGNGTATTDNNGEFTFITTYPPSMHELPPHINVRVEHYKLGTLQSRLTLSGKKLHNPIDKPISKIVEETGIRVYYFEIVLPSSGN